MTSMLSSVATRFLAALAAGWQSPKKAVPLPSAIVGSLMVATVLSAAFSGCQIGEDPAAEQPLKIGLLLDFAGAPDVSADRQRGFELAIRQVNAAGGVLGREVEFATAEAPRDFNVGIESANQLIAEGVHAIVGPSSSAASLPIAEQVTGVAGIPQISPSATSPELTVAADNDFFFRTTLSDIAQGPVLARTAEERGANNVGVIHINDPYGRGLAASFESAWSGRLVVTAIEPGQSSYLPAIRSTAREGATALVVIGFVNEATVIVSEALEANLFDQFFFGDAAKRPGLVEGIDAEGSVEMFGTAGSSGPANPASMAWEAAFIAEWGVNPSSTYVKAAYDAAIAIMFAAEAAGSLDGEAIRNKLRPIAIAPGKEINAVPADISDALQMLRDGEEIDFQGAASTLDWDANGDIRSGHIGVWQMTAEGEIVELDVIAVEL